MPDLSDATFIAYAQKLLTALGQRYDGNPELAFIDIGMVGSRGEWHNSNFSDIPPLMEKYTPEQLNRYVDMHFDSFPKTPKVMLISGGDSLAWASRARAGGRTAGATGITSPASGAICAMIIRSVWPPPAAAPVLSIAGNGARQP